MNEQYSWELKQGTSFVYFSRNKKFFFLKIKEWKQNTKSSIFIDSHLILNIIHIKVQPLQAFALLDMFSNMEGTLSTDGIVTNVQPHKFPYRDIMLINSSKPVKKLKHASGFREWLML